MKCEIMMDIGQFRAAATHAAKGDDNRIELQAICLEQKDNGEIEMVASCGATLFRHTIKTDRISGTIPKDSQQVLVPVTLVPKKGKIGKNVYVRIESDTRSKKGLCCIFVHQPPDDPVSAIEFDEGPYPHWQQIMPNLPNQRVPDYEALSHFGLLLPVVDQIRRTLEFLSATRSKPTSAIFHHDGQEGTPIFVELPGIENTTLIAMQARYNSALVVNV